MTIARIRTADIWHHVYGASGPWVAMIQGGRHMATDLEETAQPISKKGFRVLVFDRLNSGRSSIDFDKSEPEEEGHIKDLAALLKHVGARRAFLIGRSGGARIALKFTLSYPETVHGLFLWGISSGKVTFRYLDNYYFGKNLRACRSGGMADVCELEHFALMIQARPKNQNILMAIDPEQFMTVMKSWRSVFAIGAHYRVMGISNKQLASITTPTKIMPFIDPMHPISAARFAHKKISTSYFHEFSETDQDASLLEATAAESFGEFANRQSKTKQSLSSSLL